jgi:methylglutaconyl-CoA hydratase
MTALIQVKPHRSGVCLLTLNRPDRRNALSIALLDQLFEAMERLASDGSTRVVILNGTGPIFSAGMDLNEARDTEFAQASATRIARALQQLRGSPLVSIAAAHGGAYAGGAGLMAACDIAVGSSDLQIAFPEARRGMIPALICSILRSKVREGDLRELFLTGLHVDAGRAEQMGLLQRVATGSQLLDAATEIACAVLDGGPQTVVATKQLLNRAYAMDDELSLPHMLELHLNARQTEEATEGFTAFFEKRAPHWKMSGS